ncbi:hypothetical protein RHGRI_026936 [Rhododendron griersonianum]|uniref:Uncharacterized protein n=1 Tax=Rhododendron griersonianum TaxID=479676 RepID=A0AAV6IY25_9ERIC|nr:hypothetical protein RHGRI_026936 [Rhododendron griersonianum]
MEVKTDPSFEADDDVFYAELRRQILLLTLEDDDENAVFPKTRRLDARGGAKQGSGSSVPAVRLPGSCFGWLEDENSNAVPTWLVNLWRHGNGTGVFIPHIAKSRRRPKSDPSCEAADDVFYAELRRQILLLTFEDDDENALFPKTRRLDARGGAKQGSRSGVPAVRLLPGSCFGWSENENSNAAPTWLFRLVGE